MMVLELHTLRRGKKLANKVDAVFRAGLFQDVLDVALDRGERNEMSRGDLFIRVAEEDVGQELYFGIGQLVLVCEAGTYCGKAIEILERLRVVNMREHGAKEEQDMRSEFFKSMEIDFRKSIAFIFCSKKSHDDLRMLLRDNPMVIVRAIVRRFCAPKIDSLFVIVSCNFRKGLV